VGDCQVSADPGTELVTHALGSCIALMFWDPVARVGGMLHFMLPDSGLDRMPNGTANPCRYADTGTRILLRTVCESGGEKRRLVVRAAGGASVLGDGGLFEIGRKNYAALRKCLWQAGLLLHGEDVGGAEPRSVWLSVGDGRCVVKRPGGAQSELGSRGGGTAGRVSGRREERKPECRSGC
jgi:chemotaxis protein CheD